tara:strand:- start:86 stop:379 length:294 start_codon:yes stop_codon:yes gene_type:complete
MTKHLISIGIQIVPKSKVHSTYDLVDHAIAVIQKSGVKHQITPFETVMEGKYDELMKIAKEAEEAVLVNGADECIVYYRIHYRKDSDVTFEEKRLNR